MRKLSKAPRALLMAALFVTLNACGHVSKTEPQTLVRVQSVLTCPPELSGEIGNVPQFPEGEELVATQKVQDWVGAIERTAYSFRARLIDGQKTCAETVGQKKEPSSSEAVGHQ